MMQKNEERQHLIKNVQTSSDFSNDNDKKFYIILAGVIAFTLTTTLITVLAAKKGYFTKKTIANKGHIEGKISSDEPYESYYSDLLILLILSCILTSFAAYKMARCKMPNLGKERDVIILAPVTTIFEENISSRVGKNSTTDFSFTTEATKSATEYPPLNQIEIIQDKDRQSPSRCMYSHFGLIVDQQKQNQQQQQSEQQNNTKSLSLT